MAPCLAECPRYHTPGGCPALSTCPFLHRALPPDVCYAGLRCRDYNCSLDHAGSGDSRLPAVPAEELSRVAALSQEVYRLQGRVERYGVREKRDVWRDVGVRKERRRGRRWAEAGVEPKDVGAVWCHDLEENNKRSVPDAVEEIKVKVDSQKLEESTNPELPDIRILFIPDTVSGQEVKRACQQFGEVRKFRFFTMVGGVEVENLWCEATNMKQVFVKFLTLSAHRAAMAQLEKVVAGLGGAGAVVLEAGTAELGRAGAGDSTKVGNRRLQLGCVAGCGRRREPGPQGRHEQRQRLSR
jgi:hypothetical protein